jgi:hypothetical protein
MVDHASNVAVEAPASSSLRIAGDFIRQALLGEVAVPSESPLKIDGRGARMSGAVVEGDVDLSALRFERPILFEQCTFDASINLAHVKLESFTLIGCRVTMIEARGAELNGDISLSGTRLENPGLFAFNGESMRVGGSVIFIDGFVANGAVNLALATIGGRLVCNGTFRNPFRNADSRNWFTPIHCALNGFGAKIGMSVSFNTGFSAGRFCAEGVVVFLNASIVDGVYVLGGSFTSGSEAWSPNDPQSIADPSTRYIMVAGSGLHFHNARMGELVLSRIERFDGLLSLRCAVAKSISDDGSVWRDPITGGKRRGVALDLDGFRYDTFTNSMVAVTDTGWRTRLAWLNAQVIERLDAQFQSQPFTQCAAVLRTMGDAHGSRMILFEREQMRLRAKHVRLWEKISGHALRVFAGHGYKNYYALYWAIGVWLLGGTVFGVADRLGEMRPASEHVIVEETYQRTGRIPKDYEPLKPLLFSADILTPIVDFGQKRAWLPRDAGERAPDAAAAFPQLPESAGRALNWLFGGWLPKAYYCFEIAMGWLLVSIVIAGFSGHLGRERED